MERKGKRNTLKSVVIKFSIPNKVDRLIHFKPAYVVGYKANAQQGCWQG